MNKVNVFLGGSCFGAQADPQLRWRKTIWIPKLQAAGVTCFDPEVDDWDPSCQQKEAEAKANADTLVFVIDPATRAGVSMLEAVQASNQGREVIVVLLGNVADGTIIDGQTVTGRDLKDANRMRSYLPDLLGPTTVVFRSHEEALQSLLAKYGKQ